MARVTVEDCMKRVNNRFLLVHLAAKRVIQLRKGAKALVEAPKNKEIVQALREIAAGVVTFETLPNLEPDQLPGEAEHAPVGMTDTDLALKELTAPADLEAEIEALADEMSTQGTTGLNEDVVD
jgi:DNA-directed RNA polymerase subunit omega